MSTPGIANMRLLSAPEFDPTSTILASINEVESVQLSLREDGVHQATIVAPYNATWLSHATARRVVWIKSEGVVTEWLIGRQIKTMGSPKVQVRCDPLHRILTDYGIIEHLITVGGRPLANLGGFQGTVDNFLASYAIPYLVRRGVTWITAGTIDFDEEQFDLSFDGITVMGLVVKCAEEAGAIRGSGAVWQLRRDTDHYEIDVLEAFGSATVALHLIEGKGILTLVVENDREGLYTAIRPVGALMDGELERASILMASHPVISVSTDTLTVGRHGHEADTTVGPIAENDQFAPVMDGATTLYPGKYLEAPDGTFHKIEDTTAPRTVVLEAGSGASFAAGDDVVFVDDADGTGLHEVASPAAVSEWRYAQGLAPLPYAGHRNWVRNPIWRTWGASAPPDTAAGFVLGNHASDTTIDVDGLETADGTTTFSVTAGDVLVLFDGSTGHFFDRITANASVVAGAATLTIGTARSVSDNTPVAIKRTASRTPTYWDRIPADIGHAGPFRQTRTAATSATAQANGAFSGYASAGYWMDIDQLTAAHVIEPGSLLDYGAGSFRWILSRSTANGSGQTQIAVWVGPNTSDNASLTIRTANCGAGGSGFVVGHHASDTGFAAILSQDIYVRFIPNITNKLWIKAEFLGHSASATGWTGAGPALFLTDSAGTTITSVSASTWTPVAGNEERTETLAVTHTITADLDCKVRFRWHTGSAPYTLPWVWLKSVQLHMGMDEGVPFVEGSAATALFYAGQLALDVHSQWSALYTATNLEMADAFGIEATSPALELGTTIRIRSESDSDLDGTLLRVVGVTFNPFDPREKQLLFGTAPEFFTDVVVRAGKAPLFVDIEVDLDDTGVVRKVVVPSESPPGDFDGSTRFEGDPGSPAPGAFTPAPFVP